MTINFEKYAEQNKAAVDSLLAVVSTALSSAERIAALSLNAGREFAKDSSDAAKAVLGAKDPQEALAASSALVQPAVQKAVAYTQSLYQIGAEAQQEVRKLFETQYGDFQKASAKFIEEASKSAPAGSESIVAAAKEAIAKANTAFATATAMTQKFVESAQSVVADNVATATSAARKAK